MAGKQSQDTVVLHIGAHPWVAAKRFNWKEFVWDKAQFLVISAAVFVVSYGFLNYQALSQTIGFKVQKLRGGSVPAATAEILEQTREAAKTLQVSAITQGQGSSSSGFPLPALTSPVYPPDTRIVIPRILKNVPVVGVNNDNLIAREWKNLEKDIQEALKSGVVHYPGTALPGEVGNVVFTGHSSYYAWDPGRFKDVFALLHEMKVGDRVYIFHNQKKFVYEVFDIRVVKPTEIDVLGRTNDERLTLITCTPLGTNLKRLVVTAKRM